MERKTEKKRGWFAILGPGLVTGASDDDPSGIATYSQVGAQFGYSMLWTMLFTYPLMGAIQEISAWIGRVSGQGIAANLRRHYPPLLLYALVGLLVAANILNLAADIGAMGACASSLVGGPALAYTAGFALLSISLEVWVPYSRYVVWLKWLTLILFSYCATAFLVHIPWKEALTRTVWPRISAGKEFWTALIAVLGTTISPYLMFWQASEEAEEVHLHESEHPLRERPAEAIEQRRRIRVDTYFGMGVSNLVAFFIILTTAASLHAHGVTHIESAEQAAKALEPLAGRAAFFIFSIGLIGTGLLAIPVLAGSAAYAVGEALHWPVGLEKRPLRAKGFYASIAGATLLGLLLNLLKINPIKALVWSAVVNGLAAAPVMVMMMLISTKREIMSSLCLPTHLRWLGWFATAVMAAASIGMLATLHS